MLHEKSLWKTSKCRSMYSRLDFVRYNFLDDMGIYIPGQAFLYFGSPFCNVTFQPHLLIVVTADPDHSGIRRIIVID
jgi:hypothetical protein